MRNRMSEFCSTCHKVHLDVPVNNYRWFRGFNDYDNWQASGVSGKARARSTIRPKPELRGLPHAAGTLRRKRATSGRPGSFASLPRRQHRACLTPTRIRHSLASTEKFLTSGFISVDIFAVRR
jgi:hypothetical protein